MKLVTQATAKPPGQPVKLRVLDCGAEVSESTGLGVGFSGCGQILHQWHHPLRIDRNRHSHFITLLPDWLIGHGVVKLV